MSSNDKSTAIEPDKETEYSILDYNNEWLLEVAEVQLLHEATLQDLLHTGNYAVVHLLEEHNKLLWEQ
jgi:hypothetical protein